MAPNKRGYFRFISIYYMQHLVESEQKLTRMRVDSMGSQRIYTREWWVCVKNKEKEDKDRRGYFVLVLSEPHLWNSL